jgi:hypothetical protein
LPKKTVKALIGVGAFSLALAGLVPAALAPALLKAPAKEDVTTHSRSAAQILNAATNELEPVTVDLTRTLKTGTDTKGKYLGSSSVAVLDEVLSLARVLPDGTVSSVDARGRYAGIKADDATLAYDRKSGKGVPGKFGDTYDTTAQTVKFPFDTKKATYQFYDQTSHKAWPVSYTGTTKVDGLSVYVFKGTVPEVSLGQYGELTGTDTLYSNKGRTVYVEPVTGSIVSAETAPQTSIKFADGTVKQALLIDNLVPTKATIADRVADAKSHKSQVLMVHRAPYVLGVLGLLLIGGGIAAGGRGKESSPGQPAPRPDVSGKMPAPRQEPAVDPSTVRG